MHRRNIGRHIAVLALIAASACVSSPRGATSYWDEKVKDMCAKDGGVQIFERVRISRADVGLLGKTDGNISIPIRSLAHPDAPLYAVQKRMLLGGDGNVRIGRIESSITRKQDGAVVARWIAYSRSGGEVPIGLSDGSTYFCPDLKKIASDLQGLFIVEADSQ